MAVVMATAIASANCNGSALNSGNKDSGSIKISVGWHW